MHCAPTRWVSRGGIYVEKSVIPAGAYSAGGPHSNDSGNKWEPGVRRGREASEKCGSATSFPPHSCSAPNPIHSPIFSLQVEVG